MKHSRIEITVGLFLLAGFCAFGWLALQLGSLPFLTDSQYYILQGEFDNVSGIREGAEVQVAGVKVGTVAGLELHDGLAIVVMRLQKDVLIPVDSMASVKSQGIIGDKFIQITLGGDEEVYKPMEIIVDTESALDIESLISRFAFGEVKS